MGGRLRGIIIAAVSCICFTVLVEAAEPSKNKLGPPKDSQTKGSPRAGNYPTDDAPFPVRVIQTTSDAKRDAEHEAKADEHEQANLNTQMRQAEAAEGQLRTSWWGVGLTIVGGGLLFLTYIQTRRQAHASADMVNVMERTERPYLFITVTDAAIYLDEIVVAYALHHRDKEFGVSFKLENHGRTPAILKQVFSAVRSVEKLPDTPDYTTCMPQFVSGNEVIASAKSSMSFTHPYDIANEAAFKATYSSDAAPFYFYGYAVYDDARGIEHKTGFCLKAVPGSKGVGPPRKFIMEGGGAYNYRT